LAFIYFNFDEGYSITRRGTNFDIYVLLQ